MKPIKNFADLLSRFEEEKTKKTVVVVCPDDEHTIDVVDRCLRHSIARIILVGVEGRIIPSHWLNAESSSGIIRSITLPDVDQAAAEAVRIVRSGEGDVIMKGNINTDNLLKAVLHDEGLLRKGNIMSHLTAVEAPGYHKLLIFSDAAVIPRPDLPKFDAMVRYDVNAARVLGIEVPKVALIHFTEKKNSRYQHTLDYEILKERAAAGEYGPILIGGPMDVKTACDAHSGDVKGIVSDVNGDSDILIFPLLEAANTFYKTMSLFGRATMAGVITGTDAPVVVPSRADTADSKFFSLALACILADSSCTHNTTDNS